MDPIAGTCSQRPAGAAAQRGSAPLRARCRALPGSGPAVRKGRCASPLKRLPSTPLLTGLPPRFFRHWRRSAPAVPNGRCASPLKRLPATWPRRRRKGAMNTSKKWRKPLFRQPEARRSSGAAGSFGLAKLQRPRGRRPATAIVNDGCRRLVCGRRRLKPPCPWGCPLFAFGDLA